MLHPQVSLPVFAAQICSSVKEQLTASILSIESAHSCCCLLLSAWKECLPVPRLMGKQGMLVSWGRRGQAGDGSKKVPSGGQASGCEKGLLYVCVPVGTHACIYASVHTCACMHMYVFACNTPVYICMCIYVCVHMHVYLCSCAVRRLLGL